MPDFNFPNLLGPFSGPLGTTWYAALLAAVALPILIHLINMLRHRRVPWAAMEFLLLSHKKNRTWVRLKQLLLLLMRIAALAAVGFLVAQPLLRNQLARLLGATSTHHIVLLDDSFSMSDHWADTSAFAEAKKAVERLGQSAAERAEAQTFTLVRFSRVGRIGRDAQLDLQQEPVNGKQFLEQLKEVVDKLPVSQTAAGPIEALKSISQLLGDNPAERRVVYLFTDFRHRDWNDPAEAKKLLAALTEDEVELRLINCVDRARPNLAIAALEPGEGIQAARVPFDMEVTVRNFGKDLVRDVTVSLEEDGHARAAVVVPQVPAGQAVKQKFPVTFQTAGEHQITAKLDGDAVSSDNLRYAIVRLPPEVPVLMVDGDADAWDAKFVSIAAAPGGAVRTGIRPQIEEPRFLAVKSPDDFLAINLFNVDHLDRSAIEAIERFVSDGGGVAVFLGERSQTKFINEQLYRDGAGFFPVPVKGPAELLLDRLERAADIRVESPDEYIFRVFGDERNPFAAMVNVQRYFAVPDNWKPDPQSTVKVLARLRNQAPLAVARTFGKGRVVAFLTTAAPAWNNWARTPSFVVVMQDLQAYLAHRTALDVARQVGAPLEVRFDAGGYLPTVSFIPAQSDTPGPSIDATPSAGGQLIAATPDTDAAGIYRAMLTKLDNAIETRRFAFNVDPNEGDLATASKTDLAARLEGVKYLYEQVEAFQMAASEAAGRNLSMALLALLVVLLLLEQLVAWWASYHPAARAAAKGGAA